MIYWTRYVNSPTLLGKNCIKQLVKEELMTIPKSRVRRLHEIFSTHI